MKHDTLRLAVRSALALTLSGAGMAGASDNPFAMRDLGQGYMQLAEKRSVGEESAEHKSVRVQLHSMAMLFMVEERERHNDEYPLLSCNDIEPLLRAFLPRRDIEHDEVLRQMDKRHRRRQASIDHDYDKQLDLSMG